MDNDLISRSAAVEMLRDKAQGYTVSMFATSGDCNVARVVATECAAEVKNLPTVNAVPVRHGRWILEREPDGKPYCFHCSVCDGDFHYIGITVAYDYCPNCGAKMQGGTNEK